MFQAFGFIFSSSAYMILIHQPVTGEAARQILNGSNSKT